MKNCKSCFWYRKGFKRGNLIQVDVCLERKKIITDLRGCHKWQAVQIGMADKKLLTQTLTQEEIK